VLDRDQDWDALVSELLDEVQFPDKVFVDDDNSDFALNVIGSTAVRVLVTDVQERADHRKAVKQIHESFVAAAFRNGVVGDEGATPVELGPLVGDRRARLKQKVRDVIVRAARLTDKKLTAEQHKRLDACIALWGGPVDGLGASLLNEAGEAWYQVSVHSWRSAFAVLTEQRPDPRLIEWLELAAEHWIATTPVLPEQRKLRKEHFEQAAALFQTELLKRAAELRIEGGSQSWSDDVRAQ